ncbi:glycosyltransferase family 4 protein [Clostridium sp. WLY-B-L2]|uniref:Glycosyltransferase family 4 protein n=1 Tax=Clostridium aromativorans TaxID=2836848 RepID=A0ABS8N9L8_9CLOT|nr:glycosyltransferase family 4 protein [Clostridium aromativorans]MCC9296341.1 glycosyltransferase family 4 protein [Clostridium aromativorans]
MKKIRILHITQSNGGVLEYLKILIKYMDRGKFEFYLLASREYEEERKNFEEIGCKLDTIVMVREISPNLDLKSIIMIRRYIKKINPDIIHLHSSKAGALGRIASMFLSIPVVYNAHGWAFDMDVDNRKKLIYVYVEKVLANFTDVIINISNHEKNSQLKYNIKPKKYTKVIYNGIDLERYKVKYDIEKIKRELNIPSNAFVVGMVARISAQKSPESFIQIANSLKKKLDCCYFILVGDGELRSKVEELIDRYRLRNNFLITGWTDEVPKYVSLFDVGILTSKWEGFGLVLAEYMAANKPVVAFNSGGIPDVVRNNYNGLLIDYGDIDRFCHAIIKIKNNDKLRKYLVNNGYKSVNEMFNAERVAREHEELYLNLMDM